ncbi:dihydrolipoyl dehydrogenase family protein [Chloroflexus sp.]|uniref:dihydrolipoyl dehydrogenase family protein n=1 Tax=Chloroflexus sp. TaxID=1904827 RepID=UPI00260DFACF|nr:NAD(P)/FAD-dependent oxidoreductase [uncultured Chloroflexus sp.]
MKQIVVIGGGPAGVEAAVAAAQANTQVTLISEGPIGGRTGWDSLLPSKVWLHVAEVAAEVAHASVAGVTSHGAQVDPVAVLNRIKQVAGQWSERETQRLRAAGVKVINGVAAFSSPHELIVRSDDNQQALTADAVIIATGSVPRFPPTMKPDGQRIIAPRFASHLSALPPDMIVIGGGPTGSEFASLFSRLGVKVTWLVGLPGVLPMFDPAAGAALAEAMTAQGVAIHQVDVTSAERTEDGVVVTATDGTTYTAAMAFLAIGRVPDLSRLNLAAAGVPVDANGQVTVDSYGRTAVSHIFAVGDAAGGPMLANRALAQAWVAGRTAADVPTPAYCPYTVVSAVYTVPEIAQVGIVTGSTDELQRARASYAVSLKSYLANTTEGWIELTFDPTSRQIRGGVAVGAHAADLLAPVALAIQTGATLADLSAIFAAYPTLSEAVFAAARAAA